MDRYLFTGLLVSALIHGGIMFGDRLITFQPARPKAADLPPKVELIPMPSLPPDEPDPVELSEEIIKPDLIPPMQQDVPQMASDTSFIQKLQPPPPDTAKPTTGIITIPPNRERSSLRDVEIFDVSKLDQQPVARFQAQPQYPPEMRRTGVPGEVVVDFIVNTSGDVQNASAIRSSHREFEAAAVQAVSKWKFKPGRKNGRSVMTRIQVPIVFILNGP